VLSFAGCRIGVERIDPDADGLGTSTRDPDDAGRTSSPSGDAATNGSGGSGSSMGSAGTSNGSGGSASSNADGGPGAEPVDGGTVLRDSGLPSTFECADSADCVCAHRLGHDYWFCENPLIWGDAQAQCESVGADLVRVETEAENVWLTTTGTANGIFLVQDYASIGGSAEVDGIWRWVDGQQFWEGGPSGSVVNDLYANWHMTSPGTSDISRCVGMFGNGIWQNRSCTMSAPFICETRYVAP
jgi:hypothetical protein